MFIPRHVYDDGLKYQAKRKEKNAELLRNALIVHTYEAAPSRCGLTRVFTVLNCIYPGNGVMVTCSRGRKYINNNGTLRRLS